MRLEERAPGAGNGNNRAVVWGAIRFFAIWAASLWLLVTFGGLARAQTADPTRPPEADDAPAAAAPADPGDPPLAAGGDVGTSSAEGDASTSQVRPRSEFADAPRDVDARNAIAGLDRGRTAGEWVGFGALLVPRYAFWAAWAPLRGFFWAYERYGIAARLRELLSGGGPVSIYPSLDLEPGFGISFGVGASLQGVLSERDKVKAWARFFGRFEQAYGLSYETGDLLSDTFELALSGSIEELDASRFFGFGSSSEVIQDNDYIELADIGAAPTMLDAVGDPTNVDTRFDQTAIRVELDATQQWVRGFTSTLAMAFTHREFRPATDAPGDNLVSIESAYDTSTIPGFDSGQDTFYIDLETALDTRHQPVRYLSPALPASGWKLVGFGGYGVGLSDGDPSNFGRYGADVQRWIDVYGGDRVLILRGAVEGIIGDIDDVSFVDLPRLGGSRTLRGFPNRRFRDRISTLAGLEFRFPIARVIGGYVFFDTGGVWRQWADFDAEGLRHGGGIGIQIHTQNLFLFRLQLAGGTEGAVINLSFNPTAKVQPRTTRN